MSDIRRVQRILFRAVRKAAPHVDQTEEGAFIFTFCLGEVLAAITTELALRGTTLRNPGGVDKLVRATLDPIEKMLRENFAAALKAEAAQPRH